MEQSDATIFVIDDDERVRTALQRLLGSVNLRAETFATAHSFFQSCKASQSGCIVLDVRMPGLSGPEVQEQLEGRGIHLPVIIVTGHGDVTLCARMMKAGAADFLLKPINDQELIDAVHRAIARDGRMRQVRAQREDALRRVALLTPRERQVLSLVVTGKMNKHIASELGISEKTIKVHRAHVMEKLQAESVPDLVRLAQAAGIGLTPDGGETKV